MLSTSRADASPSLAPHALPLSLYLQWAVPKPQKCVQAAGTAEKLNIKIIPHGCDWLFSQRVPNTPNHDGLNPIRQDKGKPSEELWQGWPDPWALGAVPSPSFCLPSLFPRCWKVQAKGEATQTANAAPKAPLRQGLLPFRDIFIPGISWDTDGCAVTGCRTRSALISRKNKNPGV